MFKFIQITDSVKIAVLKALIYGEPGIGKTSLSFTAKKPLHLDFDKGLQRACYRQTSVEINSWEDVILLQNSKDFEAFAPDTLIMDTVGTMLDNYIAAYVKKENPKNAQTGGELSLKGYGAMKNIFNQFLNWAISKHINLIFLAHSTEEKQADKTKFIPKVTGGSYDIIREKMDLIGYFESKDNKRMIDFAPRDTHIGKDCAEIGLVEVPSYKGLEYRTFMSDVLERTLTRMNSLSDNQTEIMNKIFMFESQLVQLTVEKCNGFIDTLKDEKDTAIQLQMFELLKASADKVKITYDKNQKVFKNVQG